VDPYVGPVVEPPVTERLHHREVRVPEVDVLADDGDVHGVGGCVHPVDEGRPLGQIGLTTDPEMVGQQSVETFPMQDQGNLVDRGRIRRTDHSGDRHVAQEGDLLLEVPPDRAVGTAHDRVRLQTECAELLDGVLGRLRLELSGRTYERHQRHVDERASIAADLVPELTHGFEEGERLDIAYGAANLDNLEVRLLGLRQRADPCFDLVGDVRDHLHRLAQVIATPLLREHRRVHGAGREVGPSVQVRVEEALVVAQIEVGLGAVVQHEDLSVLERVHRPGIDIDVRIQLLEDDLEPAGSEEAAEGGGGDALAESGGDTPRDEDVLRALLHHGTRL
jgi:hypothetical protein